MKSVLQKSILILFCAVSSSVLALGREVVYDEVFSSYAGSIAKISHCGDWQDKEVYGEYRLIELSMYAQSFLYVDRVVASEQDDVKKIVGHTGFVEFNNDHAELSLSKVSCKVEKNILKIEALAENGNDESIKKIKIQVKLDNSYSIQGL
jgi:anaerobic glycerol-3-phosphate dehydrogenase